MCRGKEETGALPDWAVWTPAKACMVGVEEEVMLLDPARWRLAQRIDDALAALGPELRAQVSAETHQAAIELATKPSRTVRDAAAQLAAMRAQLAAALKPLRIGVAAAGTHPTAVWSETEVTTDRRHRLVYRTMRELAHREPTFALHVHVGVDDARSAMRLFNRMRAHLPLLLALSANSPYWQGRDSGLASARTAVFQAFPRTGIPRAFDSYDRWAGAVDGLLHAGAIPEPTFLWWDVRLQPRFGTVEIRVMDVQSTVADTVALVALVQSVARLELEEGFAAPELIAAREVLDENRFLAARDGMDAALVDPVAGALRPARALLDELLAAAAPHADALGCRAELDDAARLAALPGAVRQRALGEAAPLPGVARALAEVF
jgi:carboxylate-amine ligase